MLQVWKKLEENYTLLDKYLYTPVLGTFLGFFLVWVFMCSCGTNKMTLEQYVKKYPVIPTTIVRNDTIYEVDTFPQYVTVDCDSVIKSNKESFIKDSVNATQGTKSIPKSNKVVKEVYTTHTKMNTTIEKTVVDSAKLDLYRDSMSNLNMKIAKLGLEKEDCAKDNESIKVSKDRNKTWKLYFLIAFIISMLSNVLLLWLRDIQKKNNRLAKIISY